LWKGRGIFGHRASLVLSGVGFVHDMFFLSICSSTVPDTGPFPSAVAWFDRARGGGQITHPIEIDFNDSPGRPSTMRGATQ
jgi:hypothetical protein